MQPLDLVSLFTAPLERCGVPYFVTGSVAALLYGEPRMTHDVDLVLTLSDREVPRVLEAFPESDFYVPPLDVVRIEVRRSTHGHFNLIHHETGFKADLYLTGHDPLHAWAMGRRRRAADDAFWVAPPEYVIVRKLAWYREGGSQKHLRDIRGILALLGADATDLDHVALQRWIDTLGLAAQWRLASPESEP